jgi:hypothetical protein
MKKIVFFLILLSAVPLLSEKIYRVLSRGSVLDKSTGLVWTRCPLSLDDKPIYDFNCKGEKNIYTLVEARSVCNKLVHEGRSDWRLPTIRELQSIVYYHHKPTEVSDFSQVVEQVFPGAVTQSDVDSDYDESWKSYCVSDRCYQHYWSSTDFATNSTIAWAINFYSGVVQWDLSAKYKSVRCVAGP